MGSGCGCERGAERTGNACQSLTRQRLGVGLRVEEGATMGRRTRPMVAEASERSGGCRLWIEPEVHAQRARLPGNVRQRVKHALEGPAADPRPAGSQVLNFAGLDLPPGGRVVPLACGQVAHHLCRQHG